MIYVYYNKKKFDFNFRKLKTVRLYFVWKILTDFLDFD